MFCVLTSIHKMEFFLLSVIMIICSWSEHHKIKKQITKNRTYFCTKQKIRQALPSGLDIAYQINFELAKTVDWKTLKSGCLSLLTIRSFGARDGLGLSVRVWLGFGLGGSVRAIDSLSDATPLVARTCKVAARHPDYNRARL
eukprot:sb/3474148/